MKPGIRSDDHPVVFQDAIIGADVECPTRPQLTYLCDEYGIGLEVGNLCLRSWCGAGRHSMARAAAASGESVITRQSLKNFS
jgi:hypothetical protein